jgi:hypothetical protein
MFGGVWALLRSTIRTVNVDVLISEVRAGSRASRPPPRLNKRVMSVLF